MNKVQIANMELLYCVKALLLAFSAAVSSSGELYTWGRGNYGRLGHGCSEDHNVPTLVADLKGIFSGSSNYLTFEVFVVLKIHIVVFFIMTACSLVDGS
jgi:alpha-tubulin suppressor-like RCC1 family protein